jgi:hypothetical protein
MSDYKSCMATKMKKMPRDITKEERKRFFCVYAKTCSKENLSLKEAEKLCGKLPKDNRREDDEDED